MLSSFQARESTPCLCVCVFVCVCGATRASSETIQDVCDVCDICEVCDVGHVCKLWIYTRSGNLSSPRGGYHAGLLTCFRLFKPVKVDSVCVCVVVFAFVRQRW